MGRTYKTVEAVILPHRGGAKSLQETIFHLDFHIFESLDPNEMDM
jgi:hypothetical protein